MRAFVDESERNEEFYFLGALICTPEQQAYITAQLDIVVAKHAREHPAIAEFPELHASTMMNGKRGWGDIPHRLRRGIFEDVLFVVGRSGCFIQIEGIDVTACNRRTYGVKMPPRERAFSHLLEKIDMRGRAAQRVVKVVADEHHTAEVSRSNFSRYRKEGTYGYRPSTLQWVAPDIDFIPSHTSRPLQAADHVTYLFNRLRTWPEKHARTERWKQRAWELLELTSWARGSTRIWP